MSAVAEETLITPEEFLRMPNQKDFELIDGKLVSRYGDPSECRVSILSSWVGGEIFGRIRMYLDGKRIGWVFPADSGFQCFPDRPRTVRCPDVSFVKADRLRPEQIGEGWLKLVPDLIVEVISPNDLAEEVEEKIEMFLKAGVPLIWVVSPAGRNVKILRNDGSIAIVREGDELSGEDILPGFVCPVSSIFLPKTPSA
jgi:Uma2 family endonuclease